MRIKTRPEAGSPERALFGFSSALLSTSASLIGTGVPGCISNRRRGGKACFVGSTARGSDGRSRQGGGCVGIRTRLQLAHQKEPCF
jgi:hypothetical protein